MLSRHFLRSKVLQTIYAGRFEGDDLITLQRQFEYHVGRLSELGFLQLALLPKTVEVATSIIEESKKKFRPTEEDRNPRTNFIENTLIRRMTDNFEFKKLNEKWGGCWETHEDLVREAFLELRTHKEYKDYAGAHKHDFADDKQFAILLFRYLMNREAISAVLSDRSLLWEDDFDQIAQYNYMMLKTIQENSFDEAMPWPLMYDKRVEKDEEDMSFARQLLRNTVECREEAEGLIRSHLQGWEFERVSSMDILLINMAVAEFVGCPTIPEKVTVDEYIELSKEFSSDRSKLFINGILDKLIIELRSKGRINKMGRGLII